MGADDALFLGFGENVHDTFEALRPVAFREAVHEADVDVIGAEFSAEAVKIGAGRGGVACPGLGEDGDFVARDMLEGFRDVGMATVGVRRIEEAQALIVTVEEKAGEAVDAERGLMRMMADAEPNVTVSEALNLRDRGLSVKARARRGKATECNQAAPAVQAERRRNSRRFMGPPQKRPSRGWYTLMDGCVRAAVIKNWGGSI